ncbi:MAG: hypothetical protein ACW964_02125 [Candidatus Hodarchaeales archaeon]|jgi:hypothetical protein
MNQDKEEKRDRITNIIFKVACMVLLLLIGIHYFNRLGYFDKPPEEEEITEIGVWNRILSNEEIDELYNLGEGVVYSNEWGDSSLVGIDTIFDYSPYPSDTTVYFNLWRENYDTAFVDSFSVSY